MVQFKDQKTYSSENDSLGLIFKSFTNFCYYITEEWFRNQHSGNTETERLYEGEGDSKRGGPKLYKL